MPQMFPFTGQESGSPWRAHPPGRDAESLRRAYLALLKLSLCDLTGASTREVRWTSDKRVFSRTLTDAQQLRHRAEGKDWPLDGLTMVGLRRLEDLQACVESIVADGVPGDLIEAGAWRGGASILIRATLDGLGARDRTLWVADSFQGFPAPDGAGSAADQALEADLSRVGFLAPPLDSVAEHFARFGVAEGVEFVPGFFEETMASLRGRTWSLVRLDADTYRATRVVLDALYPGLEAGGYLIVDDYFHPYLPESCRRAVDDYRAEHAISEPVTQIDWNGARWRKREPAQPAPEPIGAQARVPAGRPPERPGTAPIPTDRELQLQDEIAALRAQLDATQAQLRRRDAGPLRRLRARLRHSAGGA